MKATLRCACGEGHRTVVFQYDARPDGETVFDLPGAYCRRYDACGICGHFFSVHEIDLSALYEGAYVDSTYKSSEGMPPDLAAWLAAGARS